ncbi:unnamed protein product [Cylicostephanus goldi]|uniref:Uncharacterized protein n=1 Tax=Cylicostephanus goldi TaxID=71465 RepID=A0A3P7QJS1_CYLGO|nr:unnamed protein product [Cylicostephanus goldi]
MKFAYAQRTYLGDAKFVPTAMRIAKNLTTPEYTKWVVERIKDKAQPLSYYGGFNESQVSELSSFRIPAMVSCKQRKKFSNF